MNSNTKKEMKICACAGLGGGATFAGVMGGFLTTPAGGVVGGGTMIRGGAAATPILATGDATLKNFQVGTAVIVAGLGKMLKDGVCAFVGK